MPAWLIYAWSEEGKDVAWTKQDFTRKIKREYDKNRLDWWFTENYNNGRGVGSAWAVYRGGMSTPDITQSCYCENLYIVNIMRRILGQEGECQEKLDKRGIELQTKLKFLSETQFTTQTVPTPVKK